jgi:hypothetical protein
MELTTALAAADALAKAADAGNGKKDMSAVAELYRAR